MSGLSHRQCPWCSHWVELSDSCPPPPDNAERPEAHCRHIRTVPESWVRGVRCEGCDDD